MSKPIVPPTRPNLTREKAEAYFEAPYSGLDFEKYPLYRLSIRGYYKKSFGDPTKNDFGIYDDAIFLLTKDGFWAFNGNTDPTKQGVATLVPGMYFSQGLDLHQNRYPALCQRLGEMKVWRYNPVKTRWIDTGNFGVNCHSGGKIRTNSEACETIYPMQYGEFLHVVIQTVGKYGWNGICVPNLLIEY
jgi:lysozyme